DTSQFDLKTERQIIENVPADDILKTLTESKYVEADILSLLRPSYVSITAIVLLRSALASAATEYQLFITPKLMDKCIKLHEIGQSRRGAFLIGSAGSGKTAIIQMFTTSCTFLSFEFLWVLNQSKENNIAKNQKQNNAIKKHKYDIDENDGPETR
ncbi:MAG: hypothetical protein EZS28_049525, partial [Streblomastix strix]